LARLLHGLGRARASGLCSTQCPVLFGRAHAWLLDLLGVDDFQSMVGKTVEFNLEVKRILHGTGGQPLGV